MRIRIPMVPHAHVTIIVNVMMEVIAIDVLVKTIDCQGLRYIKIPY